MMKIVCKVHFFPHLGFGKNAMQNAWSDKLIYLGMRCLDLASLPAMQSWEDSGFFVRDPASLKNGSRHPGGDWKPLERFICNRAECQFFGGLFFVWKTLSITIQRHGLFVIKNTETLR